MPGVWFLIPGYGAQDGTAADVRAAYPFAIVNSSRGITFPFHPDDADWEKHHLIHAGVYQDFAELDALLERFSVVRCVIDGLPETHATREFARKHGSRVSMNFFNDNQRGAAKWDEEAQTLQINRTEALDASRSAVREKKLVLPRQSPIIEVFARHMAADAKILDEDEETGAKKYRYIRTGADHFSLAFTYAWMATCADAGMRAWLMSLKNTGPRNPRDNPAFTSRYFEDTRTHDGREIKPLWGPSGFW